MALRALAYDLPRESQPHPKHHRFRSSIAGIPPVSPCLRRRQHRPEELTQTYHWRNFLPRPSLQGRVIQALPKFWPVQDPSIFNKEVVNINAINNVFVTTDS